jgi:hypothetical protein
MEPMIEKVLSFVRQNGPVLPVQVGSALEKDSFYAGAILSDLLSKKLIHITSAKIGGSPVYYTNEQKEKLIMLYKHLPMREKEAYDLLKEKKTLKDTDANPAIRVALRMIKDFAIPTQINNILVWRWYLTPEAELKTQEKQSEPKKPEAPQQIQQKLPQRKQPATDEFSNTISSYLTQHNITKIENISQRKNREIVSTITIPSKIGNLDMLLIAKNKKKINDSDLSLAHQKGQSAKLPVLFLTTGELTKKATQHREKNLKGYVMVRHL